MIYTCRFLAAGVCVHACTCLPQVVREGAELTVSSCGDHGGGDGDGCHCMHVLDEPLGAGPGREIATYLGT